MTLGEKIKIIEEINPDMIISLKNKYGVFWTGKAKFVFSHVTYQAWNGTDVEVI